MKSPRLHAMDLLSRREHSRHELCNKLASKDFSSEEIEAAVDQLASEGLQDDARFAEAYTHYRAVAGFGPRRIEMELQQRGVSETLVDRFMWQDSMDWPALLETVWQKKFAQPEKFATKAYAAQLRFLTQRGFESEAIHNFLQQKTVEAQ